MMYGDVFEIHSLDDCSASRAVVICHDECLPIGGREQDLVVASEIDFRRLFFYAVSLHHEDLLVPTDGTFLRDH